ncbi:PAS domain S-box protein [Dankookia rubra]|uniref:histidine kinase n=1 Tax=Dankookia rubra TaxID=1442381 RepID=A0A4R5Q899_9PROT|nr:ATP-binding protein [Dankookia rubra]TDH59170.1 PAS domain S-box protein [Dankookia rubra]
MSLDSLPRPRHGLLLGLALVLLLIGAAHLAVEVFLDHERRQAEDAGFDDAGRTAEAARLTLLRTLDVVQVLSRMSQERATLAAEGNAAAVAAMEALARQVARRRAFGILQVALVGPEGRVAWSSEERWQTPVDLSDRAHFRAHLPGPDGIPPDRLYISEPLVGRVTKLPTIQASRVVLDEVGRFAGVAVISLDPFDLSRLLRELLPDEAGVISVIREDGIVLARSQGAAATGGDRLEPDSPAMALLRSGREGNFHAIGSPGGRTTYSAIRRVPDSPVYVAAGIAVAQAAAVANRLRTMLRAGEVALALLAFGTLGLFHQRRQRHANQAALATAKTLQRQLARVLEGLPGSAYRAELDAAGQLRFLYGSSSITGLTGLSLAEARDLPAWLARIEAAEPPDALQGLHRRAAREGRQMVDVLFRRPDGTRCWLRITVQPVRRHPDGRVELVGYVADVTEQREAFSAVVNSAKLATLGEMATGLAHELNQPVAIMALAAENTIRALRRRGPEAIPDALRRMERIGALAQRAKAIIDHLRAFGRTDPGPLDAVSVAEAARGAAMLVGAALREAAVTLVLDLPPDLPRVRGRQLLLEQVLINLLLNARDALLEGPSAVRRITLAARPAETPAAGAAVVLTVADTGPGIPAAALPRLFDPFFTTKPTGQGTGLGLTLCHGIMRSLGGEIGAANRPAGGAEFRLLLQAAGAAAAEPAAPAAPAAAVP